MIFNALTFTRSLGRQLDYCVIEMLRIEISPAVSDHSATYSLVDFSYKHEQSFIRKVFIYKHGDYDPFKLFNFQH